MWQYIVVCGTSCLFAGLAGLAYRQNNKTIYIILSSISIFWGAFLAGARASSVGTDVLVYGNILFSAAVQTNNPLTYFRYFGGTIEPAYLLLNFLVSRFTTDPHVFYFILQLITLVFIYSALTRENRNVSTWLGLAVYYALYYAFSLNGMRQAVAMSIVIWGMRYVYQKNIKAYAISVLVATSFHYTAALVFAVYPMYFYLERSENKLITMSLLALAFFTIVAGYQSFIRLISVFVPKYARYLTGGSVELSINPLIIRLPFILVLILFRSIYKTKEDKVDFWIVLLLGDAVLFQLRSAVPALYRMSMYFGLVKIHAYPSLGRAFTAKSQGIVNATLVIVLMIIWYYQVVLQGNEGVYPYTSDVVGWLN